MRFFPSTRPLFVLCFCLAACGQDSATPGTESENAASATTVVPLGSPAAAGSSLPHLAVDARGNAVLSWVEPQGSTSILKFATLEGDDWSPAREVARGDDWFVNWADFPSVEPLGPELWGAHWLKKRPGGTYSYDVTISLSKDGGATWETPFVPHTDGTPTEHGFVSLFGAGGRAGAVWLDGRETGGGGHSSGQHSEGEGGSMTLRSALFESDGAEATTALLDDRVCDCCQTDVALTMEGPIVVYRDRTSEEVRDVSTVRCVDGEWQPSQPVAKDGWVFPACPVNGPAVAAVGDSVAVAWFTGADENPRVLLALSQDGGATFDAPFVIDEGEVLGRVDVATAGDLGPVAVSWMRRESGGGATLRVLRVSYGTQGEPSVDVVARMEESRSSGFPQMVCLHKRLLFAWTDASATEQVVRTAVLPFY